MSIQYKKLLYLCKKMTYNRCAACKQLRRKCSSDCIFLPYFPPNNPQRFSYVNRIYGASNVGKMLQIHILSTILYYSNKNLTYVLLQIFLTKFIHQKKQVEEHQRRDVANSLYYEAYWRIKDPVYGCVGIITALHEEIYHVQSQLAILQAQIDLLYQNGVYTFDP
ncbi:hypothetical protein P3S68_009477 [Capsicum galapagoense]